MSNYFSVPRKKKKSHVANSNPTQHDTTMIFPYYKNNRSQAVSYQNPATLARATTSSHTLPIYRRKFNYKFPAPSLFFFKSSTRLRSIAPLLLFFFLHKSKSLIFLFPSFFLFSETKWRRQQRQQGRLCRC